MKTRRRAVAALPLAKGKRQQGQALILGLFVLVGGLVSLFFLFNTGQLTREKTKLVNTADAVAYSAGIMNARALNFDAYVNRAMLANTVTIAQTVSMASWIQHVNNLAVFGQTGAGNFIKYPLYMPSYLVAQYAGPFLDGVLLQSNALEGLATASDGAIAALKVAQRTVFATLIPARNQVMDQVARANYHDDGAVSVYPLPLPTPDFPGFVKAYDGDERTRFAEAAKLAAYQDTFVPKRSWSMNALINECPTAMVMGRLDWLERRGGTELIGFDEWKAMDTLSEKVWVPKSKTDVFCEGLSERPQGWGSQAAARSPSGDLDPSRYDSAPSINPIATLLAGIMSSSAWDYSGIPNFFDLTPDMLAQDDPRLRFAVKVTRNVAQTMTSEGRSAIRKSGRLNDFQATPAGGSELVAVSASEVFFERPDLDGDCPSGGAQHRQNCYGRDALSRGREIGSLFNPYWQVHLIQSSDGVRAAQAGQGAVLP